MDCIAEEEILVRAKMLHKINDYHCCHEIEERGTWVSEVAILYGIIISRLFSSSCDKGFSCGIFGSLSHVETC